jgi:predicted O-linked N-acetylglucosamine transferase (SPINDLY family)
VYYYRPRPVVERLTRREFDLPDDANIYGCLQAQYKLHPQFDAAIGGILQRDPKGIILLSRGGTASGEHVITARLRDAFPDVIERVRFMPSVERDRFRALTSLCDVLLAPFPFGAGDTSMEGFALNIPTVTMPTPYLKGRLTYAMYRLMKFDTCIADSVERYIEIAVKLGTEREHNRAIREQIKTSSSVLYENEAGVKDLEQFLTQVVGEKRE